MVSAYQHIRAVNAGEEAACLTCEHFIPHYGRRPQTLEFFRVAVGHCIFYRPNPVNKYCYDVCENHKPVDKVEFVLRRWFNDGSGVMKEMAKLVDREAGE